MKVLVYNFVQPDEPGKQGGGVAIYQRSLMKSLAAGGHDVISMSSGDRYAVVKRTPYLRCVQPDAGSDPRITRAIIYNSPVFAPAHTAFYELDVYNNSRAIDLVASELRNRFGDIDVFHFQNLEGLTASFFSQLRRVFPRSRLILSAHNYNVVCPQVNLWFRESVSCVDYRNGRACLNCIGGHGPHPQELNLRRMDTILSCLGVRRHSRISRLIEFAARTPFRLRRMLRARVARRPKQAILDPAGPSSCRTIVSSDRALPFRTYRTTNIELCRDVFDQVIAVSERTKQVLAAHGVPLEAIAVSYIGTAHHARFIKTTRRTALKGRLHIAFLGYMRSDKGFFFLMECLHLIPDWLAATMAVTIAAPYGTDWPVEEMKQMAHKFDAMHLHNGYTHDTIDSILHDVDLGIVPVLWEDNLPQVAIEIVSRGIPILTSDKGGAQEIAGRPDFIFEAGSRHDFLHKLEEIASGRVSLSEFWNADLRIFSMDQHIEDLMRYYKAHAVTHVNSEDQQIDVLVA